MPNESRETYEHIIHLELLNSLSRSGKGLQVIQIWSVTDRHTRN